MATPPREKLAPKASGGSLAERRPDLAAQWHPTKNGDLRPDLVVPGSGRRVFWRCGRNPSHEWPAKVADRAKKGNGCPICGGKMVTQDNCLRTLFPAIAAEWHSVENGSLSPDDVTAGSPRRVHWLCARGHAWRTTIYNRTRLGVACPLCRKMEKHPRPPRRPDQSLAARRPDLAQQWHRGKNGDLTPEQVRSATERVVWWQCLRDPLHEWQSPIAQRRDHGCPICAGHLVVQANSLAHLRPDLAAEWHPTKNGDLTPENITRASSKQVWWVCAGDPTHQWCAEVSSRTKGHGCPFCNKSPRVTPTTSFLWLYPTIAMDWHSTKNGELTPSDLRPGSNRLVWWECPFNRKHEWQGKVVDRTLRGMECPHCRREKVEAERKRRRPLGRRAAMAAWAARVMSGG